MSRASQSTLLPLDTWAKIMQINPAHFNGATLGTVMPDNGGCPNGWAQYSWMAQGRTSREELAQAIHEAEWEIARVIGYPVSPTWITNEPHPYPKIFMPDAIGYGGKNVAGQHKCIKAKWGKIGSGGRRALTIVKLAAAVTLTDADGDGVNETATVFWPTTLTDACAIKVYFAGHSGELEWEVRPARTKVISAGVFTATFWVWQLIETTLWEALPTEADFASVDASIGTNVVNTVDIYYEYNDTTAVQSMFYWEGEPSTNFYCSCGSPTCVHCGHTTQDGCLTVRNVDAGLVVPAPATYDEVDGAWESTSWTVCHDPDLVNIWYYAGEQSDAYLAGTSCEPMPFYLQQAVAWLATARLERPLCDCANVVALFDDLRRDFADTARDITGHNLTLGLLDNPFGTRKGEVKAWQRISALTEQIITGTAL